jgi:hypothetical protein
MVSDGKVSPIIASHVADVSPGRMFRRSRLAGPPPPRRSCCLGRSPLLSCLSVFVVRPTLHALDRNPNPYGSQMARALILRGLLSRFESCF